MKLSTRSRYGARLMLDLARNYDCGPIHLKDVASREAVSVKYLEQLIIPLKKHGLVTSIQGPKGGYKLARPPQDITFGQIIKVLENSSTLVECIEDPEACERSQSCPTRNLWQRASQAMFRELEACSLADKL